MSHIRDQIAQAKTADELFKVALEMKTPQDVAIFTQEYVTAVIETHAKTGKVITRDEAASVMKQNLGYFAGYYGEEAQKHIEEMFGAEHPIFGSVKGPPVTPREAFYAGVRLGMTTGTNPRRDAPAAARAKYRPSTYESLPERDRWEIDKGLGLLDWDGKS